MSSNLVGEMLVGRVDLGGSFQACSASNSAIDAMAVSIVRLYQEADELRAEVAMLQQQARILAEERDEAREALREIASLQRYEHKFWDDGDGQIDESEREKADGMYLLHAQVSQILTTVLK